jgi:acyl carrier protein
MNDSEPMVSATAERIRDFLVDDLKWQGSRSELTDDLPLIENQVVDSMSLLRLVSWLESTFGIALPDEEIVPTNFGTIAKIAALVDAKQT